MFGANGSGDAVGTWLLLMLLGAAICAGGGLLAFSGRWRRWYRAAESPIRYAPLGTVARQAVAMALFVCLALSLLLFLSFPAWLRPMWIRELDAAATKGRATGEGGPAAR